LFRIEKIFETFLNSKIVNLLNPSKESIVQPNRILREFNQKTHDKILDQVILESRKDEFSYEINLDVFQNRIHFMVYKAYF